MSCTVVAVPWALLGILSAITTTATAATVAGSVASINQNFFDNIREDYMELNDLRNEQDFGNINEFTDNIQSVNVQNLIQKEYETPFTDKDILLKTLEEHGLKNIEELFDGTIKGEVDTFILVFNKNSETGAYSVKITCNCKDNADEKINDLNSEYALNVQEAAYLSIIEKLKQNNMQIEEETVDDDNTITLTINLE